MIQNSKLQKGTHCEHWVSFSLLLPGGATTSFQCILPEHSTQSEFSVQIPLLLTCCRVPRSSPASLHWWDAIREVPFPAQALPQQFAMKFHFPDWKPTIGQILQCVKFSLANVLCACTLLLNNCLQLPNGCLGGSANETKLPPGDSGKKESESNKRHYLKKEFYFPFHSG